MGFAQSLLPEFDNEMRTTRTLLERVPLENGSWKPHAKSTALAELASHIAMLAGFGKMIAEQDGRDFGAGRPEGSPPPKPTVFATQAELLSAFDDNVKQSRAAIESLADDRLGTPWTLQNGAHVIFTLPRGVVMRTMLMNHIIHHRGQLSVYLRLNDVKLPSIYGPTADT